MTKSTPRDLALHILVKLDRGKGNLSRYMPKAYELIPDPSDRSFLKEILYGTLRWRGRIDYMLECLLRKPLIKLDADIRNILRLGCYQLLFMDRIPPYAAINESVEMAKRCGKDGLKGVVNGVLRKIGKIDADFHAMDPPSYLSVFYSHPLWMIDRWIKEFGFGAAERICQFNNAIPPFMVRTNTLKISRKELMERLGKEGVLCKETLFSPWGIEFEEVENPFALPSFLEGLFFPQDESSQLVAPLLSPRPGQNILDACAAPGGKTTHLAQLMEDSGVIWALDVKQKKLEHIEENCRRLGIGCVKIEKADATQHIPHGPFDAILADVPCSGLGVLRRNPDAKWLKKEEEIPALKRKQLMMLQNLANFLRPGGVLVYCTCTLTSEENYEVVDTFLMRRNDFYIEDASKYLPPQCKPLIDERGFLRTYLYAFEEPSTSNLPPQRGNRVRMDGLFAVRMVKKL